jgi:serralysin
MANKVITYRDANLEFYQMVKNVPLVMWDDGNPDDYIRGTNKVDIVSAGGGNDYLITGNRDDIARGDDGNDLINGGKGADTLYGGNGNDYLIASRGNDTIYGDGNDDIIDARDGSNILYGGEGNDKFMVSFDQVKMEGRAGNGTPFLWDGINDAYSVIKDYNPEEDQIVLRDLKGRSITHNETATTIDIMDDLGNMIIQVEKPVRVEGDDDFVPLTFADLDIYTKAFRIQNEQLNILSSEAPALPLPEYEDVIEGTQNNDRLVGTFGNDVFESKSGYSDMIEGRGGRDTFVFRDELNNGQVDMDFIRDFDSNDKLDIGYASVNRIYTSPSNTYVYFGDDDDAVLLYDYTSFTDANIV